MKKVELMRAIANKVEGASQKDIAIVLNAYVETVIETLEVDRDEKVSLPGIGTFSVKHVPERKGISQIGEAKTWVKPAHDEIQFKISKKVKEID